MMSPRNFGTNGLRVTKVTRNEAVGYDSCDFAMATTHGAAEVIVRDLPCDRFQMGEKLSMRLSVEGAELMRRPGRRKARAG